MVSRSTTHFSSPLFFQPVRSFPLKRETHAPCGGAFATTATPRNTAAAKKALILFTVKSPSLLWKNHRAWPEETYHRFSGASACFLQLPLASGNAWFVSHRPVGFPRFKIADAQPRQILVIALINLLQRKDGFLRLNISRRPFLPC